MEFEARGYHRPWQWIDATSEKLGLASADLITLSYGRLFDLWRERTGSPATDLTFSAIKNGPDPS